MLIWLLVLLLVAIFGVLGYYKGAVRMLFPLVGLFVGLLLALPLSPLVRPLVPMMGMENPLWSYLLPPLIVFFVVTAVFIGVGFFGHAKVSLFFKYRSDDLGRMSWERLNQRLGVCMGLVAAAVYTTLISVVVYVFGYLTVQVTPDGETSAVRYLNQARADLRSSGLDKLAAVFDPAPRWYYKAADVLGLLYHNQPLHTRLASYPPFIALSESPDLQGFASDTEFITLLAGQPSFQELVNHPNIQSMLANPSLLAQFKSIDLVDLEGFLHTGVSEKYQDPPILGRWEVDPYLTFLTEKKRNLDMTAADVRLLRFRMEYIRGFKLYVMPDQTVRLKGPDITGLMAKLDEIEKAVRGGRRARPPVQVITPSPATGPQPGASSDTQRLMADRYGISRGVPTAPTQPQAQFGVPQAPAAAAPPAAPPTADELAAQIGRQEIITLAEGRWTDEAGRMTIEFRPTRNIPQFLVTRRTPGGVYASVREERLHLTDRSQTIVMAPF